MLDHGKRGILMNDENLNSTIERLKNLLSKPEELEHMSTKAALWSREYTLDKFQEEIAKLIHD
jgi:glycosyltransferase involved in cell wall biosynthesis